MKRIAIIPARGGSKRIKNKNIKSFNGSPIISYILKTAQSSKLFDEIHVSTDSEKIKSVVSKFGFKPQFLRPQELADDFTPIIPVLTYVLNEYAKSKVFFDEVWLLMPCAALVKVEDLISASEEFSKWERKKSLLAISEYSVPVQWAFDMSPNKELEAREPGQFLVRSQDIKKYYYDTGLFAVFPAERLLDSESPGFDTNFIGQVIPKIRAIDIDDLDDWRIAELVHKTLL